MEVAGAQLEKLKEKIPQEKSFMPTNSPLYKVLDMIDDFDDFSPSASQQPHYDQMFLDNMQEQNQEPFKILDRRYILSSDDDDDDDDAHNSAVAKFNDSSNFSNNNSNKVHPWANIERKITESKNSKTAQDVQLPSSVNLTINNSFPSASMMDNGTATEKKPTANNVLMTPIRPFMPINSPSAIPKTPDADELVEERIESPRSGFNFIKNLVEEQKKELRNYGQLPVLLDTGEPEFVRSLHANSNGAFFNDSNIRSSNPLALFSEGAGRPFASNTPALLVTNIISNSSPKPWLEEQSFQQRSDGGGGGGGGGGERSNLGRTASGDLGNVFGLKSLAGNSPKEKETDGTARNSEKAGSKANQEKTGAESTGARSDGGGGGGGGAAGAGGGGGSGDGGGGGSGDGGGDDKGGPSRNSKNTAPFLGQKRRLQEEEENVDFDDEEEQMPNLPCP